MRIERRFTKDGADAYDAIEFRTTTSEIRIRTARSHPTRMPWSQVASDVLALPRNKRYTGE